MIYQKKIKFDMGKKQIIWCGYNDKMSSVYVVLNLENPLNNLLIQSFFITLL